MASGHWSKPGHLIQKTRIVCTISFRDRRFADQHKISVSLIIVPILGMFHQIAPTRYGGGSRASASVPCQRAGSARRAGLRVCPRGRTAGMCQVSASRAERKTSAPRLREPAGKMPDASVTAFGNANVRARRLARHPVRLPCREFPQLLRPGHYPGRIQAPRHPPGSAYRRVPHGHGRRLYRIGRHGDPHPHLAARTTPRSASATAARAGPAGPRPGQGGPADARAEGTLRLLPPPGRILDQIVSGTGVRIDGLETGGNSTY